MKSPKYWDLINKISIGTAQPGVNVEKLLTIYLLLPSITEQNKIVKTVESLLLKEKRIKAKAEAVMKQIELMKKAILDKAFRGELVA